jgi:hypothetical protein
VNKKALLKVLAALVVPGAVPLVIAYYAYKLIKYKDK